jgi:3-phosphoshikimate 1-carboxyvinyltransferase
MLKAVSGQACTLHNLSDSEDTVLLKNAVAEVLSGNTAKVDIRDAGSDMRFLCAWLSTVEGTWLLDGSARMRERPIAVLVEALRTLGADISYTGKNGLPPLRIRGKKLKGGQIEMDASVSSQFISAMLLISPLLEDGIRIKLKNRPVSEPYVRMTIGLLAKCGMNVSMSGDVIQVKGEENISLPSSETIESDWSSASYWYSICALSPEAEISLSDLHKTSLQGDKVIADLFSNLGVKTDFQQGKIRLTKKPVSDSRFEYDFNGCPDLAQTVAVACVALGISAKLTGLSTLKIKETDRLQALKKELEKCGAQVKAGSDSLEIIHSSDLRASTHFNTYGDHRMAMAFAPLALRLGNVDIDGQGVVSKSYPRFWDDLTSAGFRLNLQPS